MTQNTLILAPACLGNASGLAGRDQADVYPQKTDAIRVIFVENVMCQ